MSGHHHHASQVPGAARLLWWAVLLTSGFAVIEAIGGLVSGSLALLGDAGHMVSDATALGIAALAAWVSRRPPSHRHSFGLMRAEVVAALLNGMFMLVVVMSIALHAVERLQSPQPVQGGMVMAVAAAGLVINLAVAWLLRRGDDSLNTRAALLHVMGDLLGSVAALVAGMVIYFTGWLMIDPLLSLLICLLILYSALRLLRDVLNVMMEGVPPWLELPEIGREMAATAGVESVHDLHIWTISSGVVVLSAHIVIRDLQQWQQVLDSLQKLLHDRFDIGHVTLQPEIQEYPLHHIKMPVQDK